MFYAIQWLRSVIFIVLMYIMMVIVGLGFAPFAMASRRAAYQAIHLYCAWVRWSARWIVGLKSEIRGTIPQGAVLIAAKHQSFFDIILLASVLPQPKYIMKSSLRFAPFVGQFGKRIGCVAVDRGRKAEAIQQLIDGVTDPAAPQGQLIIYPQGTRVAAGAKRPYKVGIFALYEATGQTVVPAATNVGVFWPRHGIYRKPGLAVIEFLEPIAPGMPRSSFMKQIEADVESASNSLMKESGFDLPNT